MKSLIKNLYYNNPTLYPVIKSGVDLYYRLETALVNDEAYYKKRFRQVFGYEPNLLNPRSFSEKLTWLKLHQRSPIITQCADKYAVRTYVKEKLSSDDILIPLVFHTTNPKDINPEKLPDYPVIVKANHYSSEVHIIREREREREKNI